MYVSFIELSNNSLLIIGLNDVDNEGVYVWTDGSPVDYTNWDGSQPTGTSIENVVRINDYEDNLWSDYTDQTVHYVCKY